MTQDVTLGKRIRSSLLNNIVTLVFVIFAIVGYVFSGDFTPSSFTNELAVRFFRNALLIISLIIPVIAGLGLNFGIVVGALVGMLSIIIVRYSMLAGYLASPFGSLMLCFLIALPMAILVGWLTGRLYNKTRGQEMIASLMVGFFAEGIYMVILLFIIGGLIPVVAGHPMINTSGIGIRATFDMGLPAEEINLARGAHQVPGMSRALTGLWRMDFLHALIVVAVIVLLILLIRRIYMSKNPAAAVSIKEPLWAFVVKGSVCIAILAFAVYSLSQVNYWNNVMENTEGVSRIDLLPGISTFAIEVSSLNEIPVVTGLVIAAFCLFNTYFLKTKLGQDCRSVGQSQPIANAAGINIDRTRIIATILSTVFAAWGMIVFLQDMGTVSAYTAQRQIGLFSVASLLVGGATVSRASAKNAIVGLLLFHSMFIVSPGVGRLLPIGNENAENVAEYIRTFMMYAVIGVSLGLHVWKINKAAKNKSKLDPREIASINAENAAKKNPLRLEVPEA